MPLSVEDTKQYLIDSESREAPYKRQINDLYNGVLNEVTNSALSFFNSRRYRKAKDDNARARAAKKDPGIKAISGKIAKLGKDTIKIISTSTVKHYNLEGVILTDLWNKNTPEFFTMTFSKADKAKQKEIISEYYLGFQYHESQKSATLTAMRSWNRDSRGVMSSNVIEVGKVLPSMQLTSNLRQTISTMNSKAISLIDAALSETVRILITDTQETVLKAEIALTKALQKRARK